MPDKVDSDEHITIIVGPIVREIYGEQSELGHYKLAIAVYKLAIKAALEFFYDQPTPVQDQKEK